MSRPGLSHPPCVGVAGPASTHRCALSAASSSLGPVPQLRSGAGDQSLGSHQQPQAGQAVQTDLQIAVDDGADASRIADRLAELFERDNTGVTGVDQVLGQLRALAVAVEEPDELAIERLD